MPNDTKERIVVALINLLNEGSFDKITVRDVIIQAGINKNTFYYYFESIYELVEYYFSEIISIQLRRTIDEESSFYEEYLLAASILMENRNAIINLHNSKCRYALTNYIEIVANALLEKFVVREGKKYNLDSKGVKYITEYYCFNAIEVTLRWIGEKMPVYRESVIKMMAGFFDASIECVIKDYIAHSKEYLR